MTKTNTTPRRYRLTQSHRANADFGAVRTVDDETVAEIVRADGVVGLQVDTHVTGTVEGQRVDRKSSAFYPGVTLEKAHAYRIAHGYQVIS